MQAEVQHGAVSHVGRVRETNQDAMLAQPPLFVVADGMGGHAGGEVASTVVVEEMARVPDRPWDPRSGAQALVDALARAQVRVRDYVASRGAEVNHAGTTAVAALLAADEEGTPCWVLANLGDSRIYAVGPEGLRRLTRDHSVVQELLDAGMIGPEEVHQHPERHVITRALSAQDSPEPDLSVEPAVTAGRLLLCSDGINGMLTDEQIERVLAEHAAPGEAARELVRAALEAGGEDNATAVVVDVVGWDVVS